MTATYKTISKNNFIVDIIDDLEYLTNLICGQNDKNTNLDANLFCP